MPKSNKSLQVGLTIIICLVWFINGLFCKILSLVPRHELIVSRILGAEYASILTKAIGVAEVFMVIWIVSGIKSRYCAVFQMIIIATMNVMEFVLVPDLLLFGRLNIVFAFLFIILIYSNEFIVKRTETGYAINK
jgi:hypothetical protein